MATEAKSIPRFEIRPLTEVAELFPCCSAVKSAVNSPVNPLLIRCYGRTSSPVRAEFIAGSFGGERGFSAVSLPRGFRMHRGERRSAMLPPYENPMIFLLKISKCGMIIFLVPKGARLADCPLSSAQGLENAQNGKGWLLAEVGMDLGSAPRSLGPGAVLRPVS
jgi:hypothetical protein